jgi:hypothetical protein
MVLLPSSLCHKVQRSCPGSVATSYITCSFTHEEYIDRDVSQRTSFYHFHFHSILRRPVSTTSTLPYASSPPFHFPCIEHSSTMSLSLSFSYTTIQYTSETAAKDEISEESRPPRREKKKYNPTCISKRPIQITKKKIRGKKNCKEVLQSNINASFQDRISCTP